MKRRRQYILLIRASWRTTNDSNMLRTFCFWVITAPLICWGVSISYRCRSWNLPSIPRTCWGKQVNIWFMLFLLWNHIKYWCGKTFVGFLLFGEYNAKFLLLMIFCVKSSKCIKILTLFLSSLFFPSRLYSFYTSFKGWMSFFFVRYEVQGYNNEVNIWFSTALGRPCTLSRCSSSNSKFCSNKKECMGMCRDGQSVLNFANEAQFLVISEESISDLNNRISASMFLTVLSLWHV